MRVSLPAIMTAMGRDSCLQASACSSSLERKACSSLKVAGSVCRPDLNRWWYLHPACIPSQVWEAGLGRAEEGRLLGMCHDIWDSVIVIIQHYEKQFSHVTQHHLLDLPVIQTCDITLLAHSTLKLFCWSGTACCKPTLDMVIRTLPMIETCESKLHQTLTGLPVINK